MRAWARLRQDLLHLAAAALVTTGVTACGGVQRGAAADPAATAGSATDGHQRQGRAVAERAARRSWEAPRRFDLGAAITACRARLDVEAHEADAVGRYALQGRISDLGLARHLELASELPARRAQAQTVLRELGADATIAQARRDACLPHLLAATEGLRAVWTQAAPRWRLGDDLPRPAGLLRKVRRAVGPKLDAAALAPDALKALAPMALVDVAVMPPAPIPVVGAARGRSYPLVLVYRPDVAAEPLAEGLCWQRFATWSEVRGAPSGLRIYPQWRVASCR